MKRDFKKNRKYLRHLIELCNIEQIIEFKKRQMLSIYCDIEDVISQMSYKEVPNECLLLEELLALNFSPDFQDI
jgi:hypothetical protein